MKYSLSFSKLEIKVPLCFALYFTLDDKYANKIMYYSFAYLPILFTVYCIDLL